jgi:SAM-dependent methyltransferase
VNSDEFDEVAERYEQELAKGLALSGEGSDYYALKRVEKLAEILANYPWPARVMDYGCGTGGSIRHLAEALKAETVIGVDVSTKSIERARSIHQLPGIYFNTLKEYDRPGFMDLVFCNGVFHHIEPAQRPSALAYIFRQLKSGGLFAFWENNPWNLGTQYAMSRVSFDRDAKKISPVQAVDLLQAAGFVVQEKLTMFLFPRWLMPLRAIEHLLLRFPVGAQYLVLAAKP